MMKKSMSGKQQRGTSAPQHTAVGSGSRPNGGKINIPTSAPKDKHGLDGRDKTPHKPLK